MSDVVISVENINKLYRLGLKDEIPDTLVGTFSSWLKAPAKNLKRLRNLTHFSVEENSDDILWALRDVTFEVKRGEVVGIVGRNGAGKSTLLKILSRITEPTSGRAVVHGRVGSLLEVGTGFHPELTGRDNIYMNGTILGMKKMEINRKFDEIVDFSGVERFLDTPVKRYSSGMKVRLAFAVAAHLDPEILIIDEVLAVGDSEFQKKSIGKMQSVSKSGRTVLFVSHNMSAIASLCETAILLDGGQITMNKQPSRSVVSEYLSHGSTDTGFVDLVEWTGERTGKGPMNVTFVRLVNDNGEASNVVRYGEDLEIQIGVSSEQARRFHAGVSIRTDSGQLLVHVTNDDNQNAPEFISDKSVIIVRLKSVTFNSGSYFISVWLGEDNNLHDRVGNCVRFEVDASTANQFRCQSPMVFPSDWSVVKNGEL